MENDDPVNQGHNDELEKSGRSSGVGRPEAVKGLAFKCDDASTRETIDLARSEVGRFVLEGRGRRARRENRPSILLNLTEEDRRAKPDAERSTAARGRAKRDEAESDERRKSSRSVRSTVRKEMDASMSNRKSFNIQTATPAGRGRAIFYTGEVVNNPEPDTENS